MRDYHCNRVALLLLVLMALAVMLPFVNHAPNRLLSGESVTLQALFGARAWLLAIPFLALLGLACLAHRRSALAGTLLISEASLIVLLILLASAVTQLSAGAGPTARTSPGSGLWLLLTLNILLCSDAAGRLTHRGIWRWLLQVQTAIIPLLLLSTGLLDNVSLFKEYANRRDVFDDALGQHLRLLGGTLLPVLLLGIPLGIACHRRTAIRAPVFTVLNIIQTVPAVALFGLLIAPLANLGQLLASVGVKGVSGTGMVPALLALVLYALLPLVRSVVAGLAHIPAQVRESAQGMGMSGVQIFFKVDVPLALPVLLRGLRVVTVQTIGLAVIAALIGAGGFGALVFQGLLSSALDLVLLGVLPVIALAVVADALFNLLIVGLETKS